MSSKVALDHFSSVLVAHPPIPASLEYSSGLTIASTSSDRDTANAVANRFLPTHPVYAMFVTFRDVICEVVYIYN